MAEEWFLWRGGCALLRWDEWNRQTVGKKQRWKLMVQGLEGKKRAFSKM